MGTMLTKAMVEDILRKANEDEHSDFHNAVLDVVRQFDGKHITRRVVSHLPTNFPGLENCYWSIDNTHFGTELRLIGWKHDGFGRRSSETIRYMASMEEKYARFDAKWFYDHNASYYEGARQRIESRNKLIECDGTIKKLADLHNEFTVAKEIMEKYRNLYRELLNDSIGLMGAFELRKLVE